MILDDLTADEFSYYSLTYLCNCRPLPDVAKQYVNKHHVNNFMRTVYYVYAITFKELPGVFCALVSKYALSLKYDYVCGQN